MSVAYCHTCSDDTLVRDNGSCSWCDTPITTQPPTPSRVRSGKSCGPDWLTEKQLRKAHTAHRNGASLHSIAKTMHPASRYSSPTTLAQALSTEWHRRGWYVRDRLEATVKASTTHGRARRGKHRDQEYIRELRRRAGTLHDRPRCAATNVRGEPCQRRALLESDHCYTHSHPGHLDEIRGLRKPRTRNWIAKAQQAQQLHDAGTTWRLVADQLGYASAGSACSIAHRARQATTR